MYQALYRKYRPSTFEDVCGQEHITSVLKTQLQTGKVSHAYMFCGSRGTGKTTCAKILAKAVNCENPQNGEPCNECPTCREIQEDRVLDVVEMDAASNNGVDNVRRLCDEVQYLPAETKKRVYIIDEAHMITPAAFNALLKTIEEPPEHVLFIFATTEVNSIPATILSRCQRFDFKRIRPQVIVDRIMRIAGLEGIQLERDGAAVLAKLADGAMRDALSLLEACQSRQGILNAEAVVEALGLGNREMVLSLCRAVAEQNSTRCLHLIQQLYEKMSDFKEVIGDILAIYRDLLVFKCVPNAREFVQAYENEWNELEKIAALLPQETIIYQSKLIEEFYTSYDRIASEKKASGEILFLRLCNPSLSDGAEALAARIADLEKKIAAGVGVPVKKESAKKPEGKTEEPKKKAPQENPPAAENGSYPYTVKLKNLLQSEAALSSWLPQIDFVQKGDMLSILTGSFAKGVLASMGAQEKILKIAQSLSPEIQKAVLEEKSAVAKNTVSDLDEL